MGCPANLDNRTSIARRGLLPLMNSTLPLHYYVIDKSGHVDYLINNAPPLMKGIDACTYEEFSRALAVGVAAPFYLTKLFLPWFAPGAAVVNLSSSRDRMSQPQTESYSAAKGGIAALTHAMAVSLGPKI
ncbi:MAG: SDR family oxidoreductase, partial [Clostridia bacterium]|nr:SDR family oxidoreductase [Clostridia bacterium]